MIYLILFETFDRTMSIIPENEHEFYTVLLRIIITISDPNK